MTATARLDRVFFALADPTRRRMLQLLARAPARVSDLASHFQVTLPAVAKHIRVLDAAAWVSVSVSTTDRRAKICRLRVTGFSTAERWIASNRHAWNLRFDALDNILAATAESRGSHATDG